MGSLRSRDESVEPALICEEPQAGLYWYLRRRLDVSSISCGVTVDTQTALSVSCRSTACQEDNDIVAREFVQAMSVPVWMMPGFHRCSSTRPTQEHSPATSPATPGRVPGTSAAAAAPPPRTSQRSRGHSAGKPRYRSDPGATGRKLRASTVTWGRLGSSKHEEARQSPSPLACRHRVRFR
jgi:hypothetical protein